MQKLILRISPLEMDLHYQEQYMDLGGFYEV